MYSGVENSFHNLTLTGPCIFNMYLFKYSGILSILARIAYFLNFDHILLYTRGYIILTVQSYKDIVQVHLHPLGLFLKKYNFIKFINKDILKLFLTS